MKRLILLLVLLLVSVACSAGQTFYKAADDNESSVLHSRKDCPVIKSKQKTEINDKDIQDKSTIKYCTICTTKSGNPKKDKYMNKQARKHHKVSRRSSHSSSKKHMSRKNRASSKRALNRKKGSTAKHSSTKKSTATPKAASTPTGNAQTPSKANADK
ncbi:MAG: hypothetical protein K6G50_11500 [bacterium]|nr:hypothetical protein [bacterium]